MSEQRGNVLLDGEALDICYSNPFSFVTWHAEEI